MNIKEVIKELGYGPTNQDKWAQAIQEAIEALERLSDGNMEHNNYCKSNSKNGTKSQRSNN